MNLTVYISFTRTDISKNHFEIKTLVHFYVILFKVGRLWVDCNMKNERCNIVIRKMAIINTDEVLMETQQKFNKESSSRVREYEGKRKKNEECVNEYIINIIYYCSTS